MPGSRKSDLLIAVLNFKRAGIPDDRMPAAHADLLHRLRHQPGMEDAAKVRNVPVGRLVLEPRSHSSAASRVRRA
jgi:hypothetical protein